MRNTTLCVITVSLLLSACAATQPSAPGGFNASGHYSDSRMVASRPQQLVWNDLGLIPGVKIAALHGNPTQAGHYVLRLKFPANTRMPAHWHPLVEYATIVSGTLLLGMGEREDPSSLQGYEAGSFFVIPPRMAHYGRSQDEVVIELSGPGPYDVVFVDPSDDPRKR
jgi:quercetin dioxygenase-like cupin family protein